ncbi:MAG: glycosyltransferase, partial [Gammaproteobacteria bacterium]|nr:glycosyltransferase [Gammaproteobacteria bacterium]
DIPAELKVHRVFALDTKRHLSLLGRYPGFLAKPDRWCSWIYTGTRAGHKIVRQFQPHVIWSTYPIASAHAIALRLRHEYKIPWVADFRDLMTEDDWPPDARQRRELRGLEKEVITQATRCVFTTPGAASYYKEYYAAEPAAKFVCLPNGFDESSFTHVKTKEQQVGKRLTLLHAGILYPWERDPVPFYNALAALKSKGRVSASNLSVCLRATGHDEYHRPLLKKLGIDDIVELAGPLPYREVLQEMTDSDGLLIFQADNCNRQIPAKLYEYFRAGRPIFALTDKHGDTAAQINQEQAGIICQIDNTNDIEHRLEEFLQTLRNHKAKTISTDRIQRYSRINQTADLAGVLEASMQE